MTIEEYMRMPDLPEDPPPRWMQVVILGIIVVCIVGIITFVAYL